MTRFKRLSHSLYECKYHIVFCPKYRYRILKEEIGEYVKQQVYQLCQQKDLVEVLELNVQPDHVHLGRRYWGRHLWSRGYCVSTVGLDEEKIRKYVKWQEKQEKDDEATQGKLFD